VNEEGALRVLRRQIYRSGPPNPAERLGGHRGLRGVLGVTRVVVPLAQQRHGTPRNPRDRRRQEQAAFHPVRDVMRHNIPRSDCPCHMAVSSQVRLRKAGTRASAAQGRHPLLRPHRATSQAGRFVIARRAVSVDAVYRT